MERGGGRGCLSGENAMDDIGREKEQGFDFAYLGDVPQKKTEVGSTYQTPGFGLAAQLFCCSARRVIDRLGSEEGAAVMKAAVEDFGLERGRHIARRVKEMGLPLSFKNWLIYSDIDSSANFGALPAIEDGDLVVKVSDCTFFSAAHQWGLEEFARIYCRHVDYKILAGYNPDIRLVLEERQATGKDFCVFRYAMKQAGRQDR
jgi:hypothetical protein